MRRFNVFLTVAILVLFLLHAILGGFQLLGLGDTALKTVARGTAGLILLHMLIGCKLTLEALRVWRRTGVGYFRENRLFWVRRTSGLAVMALLLFHLLAFRSTGSGTGYRLPPFGGSQLAANLLLVASLAVHVLSNLRPMRIALGLPGLKRWAVDILLVLAALLLFMGAAFVVYYLRWNVW